MAQSRRIASDIGGLLAACGPPSIALWFTPIEVRAISWINLLGVTESWICRIAFITVGGGLWFLFQES